MCIQARNAIAALDTRVAALVPARFVAQGLVRR